MNSGTLDETGSAYFGIAATVEPISYSGGAVSTKRGRPLQGNIGPYSFPSDPTIVFTMPDTDGDDGYVLKTDGSGNLTFVDPNSIVTSLEFIQENVPVTVGGQTSFTLSYEPSNGKSSLLMFINQLKIELAEFSLSGSTVTYLGPLTLDSTDDVEFYYPTK
jgi:hypothetical protein